MLAILKARRSMPPMDSRESVVARALLAASRAVAAATPLGKLKEALEVGDGTSAVNVIAWEAAGEALLAALPKQYWTAHAEAKRASMQRLKRALRKQFGFEFGKPDPNSLRFAQDRAGLLIREWGNSSQDSLRALILRAYQDGIPSARLARLIRDSGIGLTERQALAVVRRQGLLTSQGIQAAKVDSLVERYSAQLLRARAESIARTELKASATAGHQASWQELVEEGTLNAATARQIWVYTPLEDICDICSPLDGVEVPIGGTFPGGYSGPPAHPNCLCDLNVIP